MTKTVKSAGGFLIVYLAAGFLVDAYFFYKNAPTGAKYMPSLRVVIAWPLALFGVNVLSAGRSSGVDTTTGGAGKSVYADVFNNLY